MGQSASICADSRSLAAPEQGEESITPEGQARQAPQQGQHSMAAAWHGEPKPEQGEACSHLEKAASGQRRCPTEEPGDAWRNNRFKLGQASTSWAWNIVPGNKEMLPQNRNKVTEVNLEPILIKSRTILDKDAKCEYSHERISENPKLKDILQKLAYRFQGCQGMKVKETFKWQLNAKDDLEISLCIIETADKTWKEP